MSFIEEKRIQKGGEERKEEQGRVGEGKEGKEERRGGGDSGGKERTSTRTMCKTAQPLSQPGHEHGSPPRFIF